MKRALKIIGLTLLGIILLVLAAITVAVNYLRPEKLTPLVERIANEYLRADVRINRIEIRFWSTFPRFDLDVDGIELRTKAFDTLPDSTRNALPQWSDSLLSLRHLSAAINIPHLLVGNFSIYDVTLTSPRVNLVQATPDTWSLDIFPPSVDDADKNDKPLEIPDFTMGTFEILDGMPVRYLSVPDSLDISVNLATTRLEGEGAPLYKLEVGGITSASIPSINISDLKLGLGGNIDWSARRPLRVTLNDFIISADEVETIINSALDFSGDMLVESFDLQLPATQLTDILALLPQEMSNEIDDFHPEMSISLEAQLQHPYRVGIDTIPSVNLHLSIPEGKASYDGMKLDRLELDAEALVDGNDLDRSVVSISRLFAHIGGMGFELSGNATDLLSDPQIDGTFKGGLSFAHLPKIVREMLPGTFKGKLLADCDFNLRRSYLNKENFHRIRLRGDATLTNLEADMPDVPAEIYSRELKLKFGTNSKFVRDHASVDSLLTASLSIDTISCRYETMDIRGRGLKVGIGCRNIASSRDTTAINPIGGKLTAELFSLRDSADSTRIHLRDISVGGALRRYKGETRLPQLDLAVTSGRAIYGDGTNRAMLSEALANLTVHPSDTPYARRRRARLDSLRRVYPTISRDSLQTLANNTSRRRRQDSISTHRNADDRMNLEVDNSLRSILRLWDAQGTLKAARVRLFTPLFPLRNTISDLNISFSTDSVHIHDTRVKVGRSNFLIDGSLNNISRALTSRNGTQTLMADLTLWSDTIDINEIAGALFAGAAFADSHAGAVYIAPDSDTDTGEAELQASIDRATASVDTASVLIIPANIEATLDVTARRILYSDLVFNDFHGRLDAFDGALNLSQLVANSDVGSIGLNALYTAPDKHNASFAFDLDVHDFRIRQFLDLVPAIDSLMPLLNGIDGVINAGIAATTALDSVMDIEIPTLKAAVKISGDSLVVMDDETFRTIGKWLLFKDKTRNMIDSMTVEMLVDDSRMQMFPFMFNLDRYKLGVMGNNDLAMNFNYHISVLKSPLPFKFGINVSGNPDKMKIRLGKAKFNEKNMPQSVAIADTTRINLVEEIRKAFSRGVSKSGLKATDFINPGESMNPSVTDGKGDTISHADSLYFINQGLIPAPEPVSADPTDAKAVKKQKTKRKK